MTMPTERVSASIVSMLSVKPLYQSSANVAMIEVGIEIAAMTVERRLPRNSRTTNAARNEPTIEVLLDAADRRLDELRPVAHDAQLIAWRQRRLDVRQPLFDVVDDLDGVGAGLLADLQQHGRIAVDAGERPRLGHAVVHAPDVVDLYRVAVHLAQHQVAELLGRLDAAAGAHRDRLRALVDAAAGDVGVLRLQRPRHVVDGQVVGAQPIAVHPDVDLPLAAAEHQHLADAVGALETPAQDLVGVFGDFADRLLRRHRDGENRRTRRDPASRSSAA